MKLNVKQEIVGSFGIPALDHFPRRYRVEGRIDFDIVEMFRVPTQTRSGWKLGRIPVPDKFGIGPARSSNANHCTIKLGPPPKMKSGIWEELLSARLSSAYRSLRRLGGHQRLGCPAPKP